MDSGAIHFVDFKNSHIPEIFFELYLQPIYPPFILGKKDATFLDIGFNIGLWSLYASPFAKQIFSYEPSKEIADIGRLNMKDNKISNVTVIQKAVSAEDGKMTFYHSTNRTMFSLNPAVNDNKESEEVEAVSLETVVKENKIDHIDFMKLDVEGTEAEIFASKGFKRICPILDSFIYEWHSWSKANPSVINSGLNELGYVVKQIPSQATIFGAVKK